MNTKAQTVYPLRSPAIVMAPERLGAMHQTRLSFARCILRKMSREQWRVQQQEWQLSPQGYGHAIYRVLSPANRYHLVVFCDEIADHERNDRVIAEKWDVTFALIEGDIQSGTLRELRENIPLQEAGRNSSKVLILARANKSVRIFEHIIDSLANGRQPEAEILTDVGYILRTTAVYGNGKFGIADFKRLTNNPDFNTAFAAQLCAVYLLRQFSLDWVHHIAACRAPDSAIHLHPDIEDYIGIGNATGLGMAPYLINHPRIVDTWLSAREQAISTMRAQRIDLSVHGQLINFLQRACHHLEQIVTIDDRQRQKNHTAHTELQHLLQHPPGVGQEANEWMEALRDSSMESQEILISCLLECFPAVVDPYQEQFYCDETLSYPAGLLIKEMQACLIQHYAFALQTDFNLPENQYWFWYRSQEKEEPRLGIRGEEPGEDRELPLDIARQVWHFAQALSRHDPDKRLSAFLLEAPQYRSIARRVWTLGHSDMGEIQINSLHRDSKPITLLRCKLAILGATKFDPRSERWVRVTFFQGAPAPARIHDGEWLYPVLNAAKNTTAQESTLRVSHNEIVSLVNKAFTGLRRQHGEADEIAHMVAELQMCGLDGIGHFTRCLAYFTPETDSNISLSSPEPNILHIDLHHDSLACHLPAISDYLIEYMEGQDTLYVTLQHCHSRFLAHRELVKLARHGISCKARWRNGANARETCYILNANKTAPELFIADENAPLIDESAQHLHLTLSRSPFAMDDIDMPHATHISSMQLMLTYQRHLEQGVEVNTRDWEELKQFAKNILVENSQASRRGAGE